MESIEQVVEAEMIAARQLKELEQRLGALEKEGMLIEAEAEFIQKSLYEEDVSELLEELESVQLRQREFAALHNRQAVIESEMKVLADVIQDARLALTELTRKKVDVVLVRVSQMRNELVTEIREALAEMASSIASLITSDIVQSRLIGEHVNYDFEKHPDLFSGRDLAMLLLDGIPLRLRPSELCSSEIEDQALWFAKCTDSIVPQRQASGNIQTF
jgi:hypothetical protein